MATTKNITLPAGECWVIRSTMPCGDVKYAESYKQWNRSPAWATIYRDWDAAWQALWAFEQVLPRVDGEIFDVVTLYGALIVAGRRVK